MVIGPNTFIADVFSKVGIQFKNIDPLKKYPEISDSELLKTYNLFSTEPFPFEREFDKLTAAGLRGALIDGEKISWYGIRNLRFLQLCSE